MSQEYKSSAVYYEHKTIDKLEPGYESKGPTVTDWVHSTELNWGNLAQDYRDCTSCGNSLSTVSP